MRIKLTSKIDKMILDLPFFTDWMEYEGEIYFAAVNYEASYQQWRPMIDLHYCATKWLNDVVIKTVEWDESRFKPCPLSDMFT